MCNAILKAAAVLFDMDGVLIDSNEVIEKAWPEAAAMYGKTISEQELLSIFTDSLVRILFGRSSVTYRSLISKRFRLILFMLKILRLIILSRESQNLLPYWMLQVFRLAL